MVDLGLSAEGVTYVNRSLRDSSTKQYQGTWKLFLRYLVDMGIPHSAVTKFTVMNFLAHQHSTRKLAYRTIATYKSALAVPLEMTFKINLDDTPLHLLMRGVFNSTPPRPAPMAAWSLNHLLAFLASDVFEPRDGMPISIISQKLLCLVLLATGRRIGEVAHLSQHVSWEDNGSRACFHWLPNYVPKHYTIDFRPHMPTMGELPWNDLSEARLCPIRSLQAYLAVLQPNPRLARTRPLWNLSTAELTRLFISTTNQARSSAGDVAETSVGPHMMRKFAASYSSLMMRAENIGEKMLLDRMGFKSMTVVKRTYINKVPRLTFKSVLPVGTFSPSLHNE